jgi:Mor family transcriptional regulator
MKFKNYDGRSIVIDMIEGCGEVVDRDAAMKAIRELCRYFGGQLVYIPVHKTTGKTTEELHGVLRDAVGDREAGLILEKIMALFGGYQIYIPMEKKAFHQLIVQEIYEKYDGINKTIGDLCREYGMSFNTIYNFYHEGRDNKAQMQFQFEENLEK